MRRAQTGFAVGIVVVLASLMACDSDPEASPPTSRSPRAVVDTSVLEPPGSVTDFYFFDDPQELEKTVSVVLAGELAGVSEGGSLIRRTKGASGDVRSQYAVVKIKVDEVVKGDPAVVQEGFAYLLVSRGAEGIDQAGLSLSDPPGLLIRPVASLAKGLPNGTRVVIMTDTNLDLPTDRLNLTSDVAKGLGKGAPEGVTFLIGSLLAGVNPQRFVLELPDGSMSAWGLNYDELLDQVRDPKA